MKNIRTAELCAELQAVLNQELQSGNRLSDPPHQTAWPQQVSVFAHLTARLDTARRTSDGTVEYSVNSDKHYGWIDECYCPIHRHLLTAG